MDVDSTVRKIKSLEIQGASNIAISALKAYDAAKDKRHAYKKLLDSRPTEPMLWNVLRLAGCGMNANALIKQIDSDHKKIVELGRRKLSGCNSIYTHCHSNTVISILKAVKPKVVYNTETRPLFQGRIVAKELASAGIKVVHFVDSAMRLAIKQADAVLLGADAITTEGKVINKIGSELVAETADRHEVPLYICTHSLKYDRQTEFSFDVEIESRHSSEVWPNHPRGIAISNVAFEQVNPDLIDAIISELGVLTPENFIEDFKKKWPLL